MELVSVIGCYYVMDRDKCWEWIKLVYDFLVKGEGEVLKDVLSLVEKCYVIGEMDEFL